MSLPVSVQDSKTQARTGSTDDASLAQSITAMFTDEPDPVLAVLTHKHRAIVFMSCIALAAFCFGLVSTHTSLFYIVRYINQANFCMVESQSLVYLPFLYLKARKFSLLFTMASLSFLCALSMIRGPLALGKQLITRERAVFSALYFSSLLGMSHVNQKNVFLVDIVLFD
jgi:hypothetical protein